MKLISPNKAADMMGVSAKTVYRRINQGELTRIKIGSATRISEDEIIAYAKKNGFKEVAL